jgi:hypothetical protein
MIMLYCPYYFSPFIVSSFAYFLAFVCFLEHSQMSEQSLGTDYGKNAQIPTFNLLITIILGSRPKR